MKAFANGPRVAYQMIKKLFDEQQNMKAFAKGPRLS